MKLKILNVTFFLFALLIILPKTIFAQVDCSLITNPIPTTYFNNNPQNFIGAQESINLSLSYNKSEMVKFISQYNLPGKLYLNTNSWGCTIEKGTITTSDIASELDKIGNPINHTINKGVPGARCNWMLEPEGVTSKKEVGLHYYANGEDHQLCNQKGKYFIEPIKPSCKAVATYGPGGPINGTNTGAVDDDSWRVEVTNIVVDDTNPVVARDYAEFLFVVNGSGQSSWSYTDRNTRPIPYPPKGEKVVWPIKKVYRIASGSPRQIDIYNSTALNNQGTLMCSTTFMPAPLGATAVPTPTTVPSPTLTPQPAICAQPACTKSPPDCTLCSTCANCQPTNAPTPVIAIPTLGPLCDQLVDVNADTPKKHPHEDCLKCLGPKDATLSGIWTALGCLPTDYGKLISEYIFKTGIGIAGGISFLYFLYGAFLILTSAGNPEKIEEAKQIIISALSGLLLIIFSIFLLRVIGVKILQIPGFT